MHLRDIGIILTQLLLIRYKPCNGISNSL